MDCLICGAGPKDRPSINQNDEACSDLCRKRLLGEIPLRPKDLITLNRELLPDVVEVGQHAYLRNGGWEEIRDGDDTVIRRVRTGHDRNAKAGVWQKRDGRPVGHLHTGSGLSYPVVNRTTTGDEVEWWACVECGAQKSGWAVGSEGDE